MKIKGLPVLVICLLAAAWLVFGSGINIPWPSIGGGATHFIVLHEATKDDPKFADLAQELQDSLSPVSREVAAAGWKLWVLDDETTDKDDKPLDLLEKLGVFNSIDDNRRELLSVTPPDKLVSKEPIPADATAESVLKMIQAKGKR